MSSTGIKCSNAWDRGGTFLIQVPEDTFMEPGSNTPSRYWELTIYMCKVSTYINMHMYNVPCIEASQLTWGPHVPLYSFSLFTNYISAQQSCFQYLTQCQMLCFGGLYSLCFTFWALYKNSSFPQGSSDYWVRSVWIPVTVETQQHDY